jgi:hypothetical protein
MTTQKLLKQIKKSFKVSNYWLEKFLHVNHGLFSQYMKGVHEAKFSTVNNWLDRLNLCLIDNQLFYKIDLSTPINKQPSWFLRTLFDSNLDRIQWIEDGKKTEENEGHHIFWDEKPKPINHELHQ